MVKSGQAITAKIYYVQLQRAHESLQKFRSALRNRRKVLLLNDKTKPHVEEDQTEADGARMDLIKAVENFKKSEEFHTEYELKTGD